MKNRKLMWGVLAILLAAVVAAGFWLRRPSDGYLRVLPARPKALLVADLPGLLVECGLKADEVSRLFPQEWREVKTGVCRTQSVYAFVSAREHFGLLAAVEDAGDLADFLDENSARGRCTPVQTRQGCRWSVLDGRWLLGFDDDALLIMGPAVGADQDALRQEMLQCFRQTAERSGQSSTLFQNLSRRDAALALAVRMDALPGAGEWLHDLRPEQSDWSDVSLTAEVHFTDSDIEIDGEWHSEHPEQNRAFERWSQVFGRINGTYAGCVPADARVWGCAGTDGKALLEQLRGIPAVRTFLLGLNMGVDADRMIGSIKGDVAVTLPASERMTADDYLLTAEVQDTDFMSEADYWLQSAVQSGAVTLRAAGPGRFFLSAAGRQAYFGADGGTLYVASSEEVLAPSGTETATLADWEEEVKNSVFFVWLNPEQLFKQPAVAAWLSAADIEPEAGKLRGFALRCADLQHMTLTLRTRDGGKQTMKELLEKWTK